MSVSFVAWTGTATAWAQNEPPPENPPANFGPPPPGHEPPPPYTPGGEPLPPPEPDIAPGFMTLDRMDTSTRLGLQVGFFKVDDVALGDGFFMRFNPYAQYVFPGKQAGIYAQLPIAHAFVFQGDGEDATGWGNLELGGFYMPWGNNDLILRAGLVAATASDDDVGAIASNFVGTYERLTDFVLIAPNSTTGRLSASTIQRMDDFFFRADGGFDLMIDRPSGSSGPSVFFRANAAAGYRLPDAVDLAFELVNLAAVNGDVDGGITERFIHTAAVTARTPGINQLHVGTIFPLDEDARGEVWILSFGYQRAMN